MQLQTLSISSLNKLCLFGVTFSSLVIFSYSQSPSPLNGESESLKFKLSATNLPTSDTDGPSDPYAMVFTGIRRPGNSLRHWHYYGSTGTKFDTPNPEWDETFQFQYINGSEQWWHFIVMDRDDSWYNPIMAIDDPIGHIEVRVEDYVRELRSLEQQKRESGSDTPIKAIQKILTFPLGGVLQMKPVYD